MSNSAASSAGNAAAAPARALAASDSPADGSSSPRYRRILLKLSGEALQGEADFGINPTTLQQLAEGVKVLRGTGVEVALVVGAGNIFRGRALVASGMEQVTADHIGMLGTVMNALALQEAFEQAGLVSRMMSAISMNQLCEDYIRRRAIRHLEKGRVVIFAGGTGNPFFTTDSAAALRAVEVNADLLVKATKVDGVYSSDPEVDPAARRYNRLGYDAVLAGKLGVMDATAIVLCRDHQLPVRVLNMADPGALLRAVRGENTGTLVDGSEGIEFAV